MVKNCELKDIFERILLHDTNRYMAFKTFKKKRKKINLGSQNFWGTVKKIKALRRLKYFELYKKEFGLQARS